MLQEKQVVFDLNVVLQKYCTLVFSPTKGTSNEFWKNNFLASDGISSHA